MKRRLYFLDTIVNTVALYKLLVYTSKCKINMEAQEELVRLMDALSSGGDRSESE